jgi:hypothetical protein
VGHQQHGRACWLGQQHFVEPGDPVAAQWLHPVVLLDALVAMALFPQALPVVGAAVLPTGKSEHHWCAGCHG